MGAGCAVSTAPDGVEAMVKAQKERPQVAVFDVALPKIFGFEVARRLREQDQTAGIRILLITSVHKDDRYRREPESLHDADGYVEETRIGEQLLAKVSAIVAGEKPSAGGQAASKQPSAAPDQAPAAAPTATEPSDQERERARRLARTILSDIDLYSPDKAAEAIRAGSFESVFADELREGRKLYDTRISAEVRAEQDFFAEVIRTFIQKKRDALGLG